MQLVIVAATSILSPGFLPVIVPGHLTLIEASELLEIAELLEDEDPATSKGNRQFETFSPFKKSCAEYCPGIRIRQLAFYIQSRPMQGQRLL